MQPQEIELIHADIMVAKNILNDQTGAANNPYMVNLGAYHAGQAIEKSLKAILRDARELNYSIATSHSIEGLLTRVEVIKNGFIQRHDFLAWNSEEISKLNGVRYGVKSITAPEAFALLKEAKNLYQEIEADYLKDNPDKRQLRKVAKEQYDKLDRISLSRRKCDAPSLE